MDVFYRDSFYDNLRCDICDCNTYYTNGKYYCVNCKRTCYTKFKRIDNRSRINVKNNCKIQHFKQLLNRLMSYNTPDVIVEDFRQYLREASIKDSDVNICVVENFLHSNYSHDLIIKYQLLNIITRGRGRPTDEEVTRCIEVFQSFLLFVQDIETNFTMKYDFYIMKIFNHLGIDYDFSKREFKDNTKKNKDSCYWEKFIKYGNKIYKNKTIVSIPEDDIV